MNMIVARSVMIAMSLRAQTAHVFLRPINVIITTTVVMVVTRLIVVLGAQSISLPALTVLVSTEINAATDARIVGTAVMKSIVKRTIHQTSNVVRVVTSAPKVPVLNIPNFATDRGIVAMDQMSKIVRAEHLSSPVAMDNAFQTIWCATKTQTAAINRMKETVLAPGKSSGATPVSAFHLPADVI